MRVERHFLQITSADFVARSAYQMGKTPLLPIFAALLGASEPFVGLIVSVSTLTGMVLKPLFGLLSDQHGRRRWLIIGTLFFALMPFTYWWVATPTHLLVVRVVHGLATAIYGPVTLAYVAEQKRDETAQRLGWFSMARSGGYIVGPALAGWLLLWLDPRWVFTLVGVISAGALWPIVTLPETPQKRPQRPASWGQTAKRALQLGGQTPAVWLAGGLEAAVFVALYAIKAFLPLYTLQMGFSTAVIGLFFSLQEAAHLILKPLGGRWGDRWGYLPLIALGMGVLAGALAALTAVETTSSLLVVSVLMGVGQALIFPCTVALISQQLDAHYLGTGMGLLGTLQNGGKVAGPLLGGFLITQLDYSATFYLLSIVLLLTIVVLGYHYWAKRFPLTPSRQLG